MQNGKHVILHIDDDVDLLEVIQVVLESNGYVVVGAESAEEGLRKYKETNPDLILLDMMMEEVDAGSGFVKELKALGNTAPILLVSSVGDVLRDNIDYSEMGLGAVFQKPIDPATLLATVRAKLRQAGR